MLPTHVQENEKCRLVIDNRNPLCVVFATQALIESPQPSRAGTAKPPTGPMIGTAAVAR